ncbi:putative type II restriction enzyme methylase subunit [Psychrobacter sp. JCM 18901]|nr:putative type II restriction enzyme methylase subunit [Psychrobacter sp. JCM 18901]
MEHYIEPAEQSSKVNEQLQAMTPDSIDPESIKVLDPAVGSGHILIEAYNVLKAIYEERGFRSREIPQKILENNLYGLDIDDRAAQLSGFALMMLARADDKRIFTRHVSLNVLALQEGNHINLPAVWRELNLSGGWDNGTSQDMFADETQDLSSFEADNRYQLLQRTVARFSQAKTFGSLIEVPADEYNDLKEMHETLIELAESGDSFQRPAAKQLSETIHQALILSIRYDAVIANPPYMGGKGMNSELKKFAKKKYPHSKSDLFAMFMERGFSLLTEHGFNAQINMQSWMFLSSYEKLRESLLAERTIITMAHLGARAFSQISGEIVQTTAWIIRNKSIQSYQPTFYRLLDGNEEDKKQALLHRKFQYEHLIQEEFKKIPGSPFVYWQEQKFYNIYDESKQLTEFFEPRVGLDTGNNDEFIRFWHEVNFSEIKFFATSKQDVFSSGGKYVPHTKGGEFRKWYGNFDWVIKFDEDSYSKLSKSGNNLPSRKFYFLEGASWSRIGTSGFSLRYNDVGFVFNSACPTVFSEKGDSIEIPLALLNSSLSDHFLGAISPTINYQAGEVRKFPYIVADYSCIISLVSKAIEISKKRLGFV